MRELRRLGSISMYAVERERGRVMFEVEEEEVFQLWARRRLWLDLGICLFAQSC